ncbi:MAG: phosphoadenylyl-sulfate reductase [Actinomycetota bacterium]
MSITEQDIKRLDSASAEEVLNWGFETFGDKIAISSAFIIEDVAVIDLAHKINSEVRVFTLDTGRLPQETYTLIDRIRDRYGINVEVHFPETAKVEVMTQKHGANLFYRDLANRLLCCQVRKVFPLEKALSGLDAWVTGLRRAQNVTRASTPKIETDNAHGGITKLNPIADWSTEDVWNHVRANKVPYSELYDKGYTSIGCAPCTRAIVEGEDERAGRWWWESPEDKECGLHGQSPSERFQDELAWIKNF